MIEKIKKLTGELLKHCHAYYDLDSPTISDAEYDRLFDELKKLEDENSFWLTNSPTRKVQGQVLDGFIKVTHSKPMLSAAKTKDINEIKKFIGNNDFYCSYKLDGLTLVTIYEDGKFKQAITRGTGLIGEDVTEQAKMITNLPMVIPYKGHLELRGECIISWENFNKTNETLNEPYSHPRNLAAGSLRQLDTNITKERNLSYVVFECVSDLYDETIPLEAKWDGAEWKPFDSKWDELGYLDYLGFETVERRVGKIDNCIEEMKPESYDYPVDGLIFEYCDKEYSRSLSATSHHEGCRVALKWADDMYETELLNIEFTMGKTGALTPTAVFKSVEIDGSIVERASVHNISILNKLDLHKEDIIEVYKANMIIPQVSRNISAEERRISGIEPDYIIIPSTCPICGDDTELVTENSSTVLMCTNPYCKGKLLGQLSHFVGRKAMNIDGMSEAILDCLINNGWVNSFQDIYHLYDHREEWINCDGFGVKSVDKLLSAIENSRKVKLENFLSALSIPNVGTSASKTISTYFNGNFNAFIKAFDDGFKWDELEDFGAITAQNINDYLGINREKVVDLASEMEFVVEDKKEIKENPFMGKNICVTGKLSTFTRDSINKKIIELGAKVASGVSAKTDFLITNTPDSGSSKNVNAKKFGTKIITEDEFLNMIGE